MSSIAFVSCEPREGLNDHRIFQLAKLAFEDGVVGRLLAKHLLEPQRSDSANRKKCPRSRRVAPGNLYACSFIAFFDWQHLQRFHHHRVFQIAKRTLEDIVVVRLLTKHLLEPHLTLANRAGRIVDLRHDSSLSADAERLGFRLWWGWRDNARAKNGCHARWNFIFPKGGNRQFPSMK